MAGAAFGPISTAPPWDWNPIGVAVDAFNTTRRTKLAQQAEARMQEAQAIENAVSRATLPYAAKKAQLEVENLRADIGYRTALADRQRAEAASLNEERMGALQAGGTFGLPDEVYQGLFGTPSSSASTEPVPKPAALGLDTLPIAEEPQRNFDLDSGTPIRLDSTSTRNPLMDTFGQSRRLNPLESFDAQMADFSDGPAPGEELAPIGSGGDVIESSKTYSPEDRDAVLASAANTLQTRGGKSTNPLSAFSVPEADPAPAASASQASPLRSFFENYRTAEALLTSQALTSSDKRVRGLAKGNRVLMTQGALARAASEFGMGADDFAAMSKMDPTIVDEIEQHRRKSGSGSWTGSREYVTALRAKRADLEVAQDLGLVKPEAADPSDVFEFNMKRVDVMRARAQKLSQTNPIAASLLNQQADALEAEAAGIPQVSDIDVAQMAYGQMTAGATPEAKEAATNEFRSLIPALEREGYIVPLVDDQGRDISTDSARRVMKSVVDGNPKEYRRMFVRTKNEVKPLAEVWEQYNSAAATAADQTDSAPANPNQDLEATVIDAQSILNNPKASVTQRAKAQAEIGSAQKEAARRRKSQEQNKEFTNKVERAGAVEAEQQSAREELNVLTQSLTVPQTRETTIGRAKEGDARLKAGPLDFDLANYQLPLVGRVRNPSVDDETFLRGLQRMAQLRVTLGEDEDEVLKELGLPRQSLAMVRNAPASGRGR